MPRKIADGRQGTYNATLPVFSDGEEGDFQLDLNGNAKVVLANVGTTLTGQLVTSTPNIVLYDQVDGTSINVDIWAQATSSMTITQASNFMNLNAGLSTTTGQSAQLTTLKNMPLITNIGAGFTFNAKVNVAPQAGAVIELGAFMASGQTAPTDGVFFRWASDGTFRGVVSYGGVESTTAALTAPTVNTTHSFIILMSATSVSFLIDAQPGAAPLASVATPAGQPYPVASTRLPLCARVYNPGTPATAPNLQIGSVAVFQAEVVQFKDWEQVLAGMGRGTSNGPLTYTQTANHANSTDPVAATLSNTAAGYTTLGGRFSFAAPAGATTDYALFAYQVPAGYQLFVNSLRISCVNLGAAVATTATVLDWSVGAQASAVSLATADSAATWAPRRVPLGIQSFVVGAAIGQVANDLSRQFETPLVVDAGHYLHIIVEVPVGTATASQVIRGDVLVVGYFE